MLGKGIRVSGHQINDVGQPLQVGVRCGKSRSQCGGEHCVKTSIPNSKVSAPQMGALNCVFVHAPDPMYSESQNYGALFMPLWVYSLVAHIPDDGRFAIQFCDVRFERIADIEHADVLLFSAINQDHGHVLSTLKRLKGRFPEVVSIIGGPICWSFDQAGDLDKLEDFDHVFIGDGEDAISGILDDLRAGISLEPVIRQGKRFTLEMARPLHAPLVEATFDRYYGAVIEVSRGCPFLCEFCDIRVLPDNNRAHVKNPDLIVSEIDKLTRLGTEQILLACDNFIGNPQWAEEVLDVLIAWQERTGLAPSLYTWLTINLYRHPRIMEKMRRAGFDLLFIGIESFSESALLETAKLQNTAQELVEAVKDIQSYGFIVVAGLIFGFDSDDADTFDRTLNGLRNAGLLSGDPSLLTALPGTPLHRRIKLSGRLREVRYGLGGFKYQTNIKYLMPRQELIDGFHRFVDTYSDGAYQYARLMSFLENIEENKNFIPLRGKGYGQLGKFLMMTLRQRRVIAQFISRFARFASRPSRVWYAIAGLYQILLRRRHVKGAFNYYQFWLFAWSNAVLKYKGLSPADFDIDSVDDSFDLEDLVPAAYAETAFEEIPQNKIDAQLRATVQQLEQTAIRLTNRAAGANN